MWKKLWNTLKKNGWTYKAPPGVGTKWWYIPRKTPGAYEAPNVDHFEGEVELGRYAKSNGWLDEDDEDVDESAPTVATSTAPTVTVATATAQSTGKCDSSC